MAEETGQTQVPEGQGQEGQPPSGPDTKELQERLDAALTELRTSKKEAIVNQRRADKAENLLLKKQPKVVAQPSQQQPSQVQSLFQKNPQQQPQQEQQLTEDDEALKEAIKESMILREVLRRGLTEEEVEGIEFNDASDLATKLDVIQQKKEIENLKKALSERGSEEEPPPTERRVLIDAGGPTGEQKVKGVKKREELEQTASKLRESGRYKEATWVALRKAHIDPDKRILIRSNENEVE